MTRISTALLITGDLFFSSQIEGIARARGVTLQVSSQLPSLGNSQNFQLLILDLELPSLSFEEVAAWLANHDDCTVVGYGSHVKTHLFEAARTAGVQHLLTRGQVGDRLAEFFPD